VDEYNEANLKVAKLCNHQKNISKNFNEMIVKINDKIKILKEKIENKENVKDKTLLKIKDQINKLKRMKENKNNFKNISLTTSKTNYIDPRITMSFIKKLDLPIDKFFTKILIEKYNWTLNIDPNFKF